MKFRINIKTLVLVALTAIATPSVVISATEDVVLDEIIAIVNDGVILSSELTAEIKFLQLQARASGQNLPIDDVLNERILERLINQEIQRQRAAALGLDVDQATINAAVDSIASRNNMNTFEFRKTLQQEGVDYNQFRKNLTQELLLDRLIQREVEQSINVSEQEIEDFISSSTNPALQDSIYRLSHLLVAVPSSATTTNIAAAKTKVDDIYQRLQQGADFGQIAATESDGRNALKGGDLGWRKLQELPGFLHAAVKQTAKTEVSAPVQSPDGFHIIKIVDSRADVPEATIESRVRHIYLASQAQSTDTQLRDKLNQIRQRIAEGEDFGDLAKELSEDTNSASNGGELPWFVAGDLPAELENTARSIKPGVVSDPFKTSYGWHILEVLERRESSASDSRLRREAELNLRQRKLEQETERWSRRMRSEAYVEVKG